MYTFLSHFRGQSRVYYKSVRNSAVNAVCFAYVSTWSGTRSFLRSLEAEWNRIRR